VLDGSMRFRPSSYDNFCWGEIQAGKPLAEVNNPQLGRKGESGWYTPAALKRRPVAVVGAGPAGLQAAAVAAQAGNLKSAPEGPQSTTLELSLINLAPWSIAPADDLPTRHASKPHEAAMHQITDWLAHSARDTRTHNGKSGLEVNLTARLQDVS
jgi:hypothetical protein